MVSADPRQIGEAIGRARIARAAGQPAANEDVDALLGTMLLLSRALALETIEADEQHASARRSADAAVLAAREPGAVASAEVAARDALARVAAELLAATIARDEADAAHTNAGGTAARQRTMAAALLARGRYTDAVAAARVWDGGALARGAETTGDGARALGRV